jgi:hypothetical protein
LNVPYHVYLVEPPTLLDDLLEDSARVYHRSCAVIQSVFHDQWLQTLGKEVGRQQLASPDAAAAEVEARARKRLAEYRLALRARAADMIREQRELRGERDRAIRAFVASRSGVPAGDAAWVVNVRAGAA